MILSLGQNATQQHAEHEYGQPGNSQSQSEQEIMAGMTEALVGVFFFLAIVGVCGLSLAIAGLAVFILGSVVVCVAFPTQGSES